jgi:hypothetical protein
VTFAFRPQIIVDADHRSDQDSRLREARLLLTGCPRPPCKAMILLWKAVAVISELSDQTHAKPIFSVFNPPSPFVLIQELFQVNLRLHLPIHTSCRPVHHGLQILLEAHILEIWIQLSRVQVSKVLGIIWRVVSSNAPRDLVLRSDFLSHDG